MQTPKPTAAVATFTTTTRTKYPRSYYQHNVVFAKNQNDNQSRHLSSPSGRPDVHHVVCRWRILPLHDRGGRDEQFARRCNHILGGHWHGTHVATMVIGSNPNGGMALAGLHFALWVGLFTYVTYEANVDDGFWLNSNDNSPDGDGGGMDHDF